MTAHENLIAYLGLLALALLGLGALLATPVAYRAGQHAAARHRAPHRPTLHLVARAVLAAALVVDDLRGAA